MMMIVNQSMSIIYYVLYSPTVSTCVEGTQGESRVPQVTRDVPHIHTPPPFHAPITHFNAPTGIDIARHFHLHDDTYELVRYTN